MKFQIGQVAITLYTVDLINMNIRGLVTIPMGNYEVNIASQFDKLDDQKPFYISLEVDVRKDESHANKSA